MTPAERQMIADLFERLATVEGAARDPAAEQAILVGLRQAPNAVYALVQTALLQDAALKRADERIRALEAGQDRAESSGSFLGGAASRPAERRSSVPNVAPGGGLPWSAPAANAPAMAPPPPQPMAPPPAAQAAPPPQGGGGSFLGTAAAAAAGAIGGSLLTNALRGMTGGGHGAGHGAFGGPPAGQGGGMPWNTPGGHGAPGAGPGGSGGLPWNSPGGAGGGELGRQAGVDDIGRSGASPFGGAAGGGGGEHMPPGGGKRGGEDDARGAEAEQTGGPFDTAAAEENDAPHDDAGGDTDMADDAADFGDDGDHGDDGDFGGDDGGDGGGDN